MKTIHLVCLVGILGGAGCSGSASVAEVEGIVTLQGQPLANVRVEYFPDRKSHARGPRSFALTDAKGHYVLQCDDGRAGAAIGRNLVVITFDESWEGRDEDPRNPGASPPASRPSGARPDIPSRYTAAVTTPLKPEVRPGTQTIDLPLVRDGTTDPTARGE